MGTCLTEKAVSATYLFSILSLSSSLLIIMLIQNESMPTDEGVAEKSACIPTQLSSTTGEGLIGEPKLVAGEAGHSP